MPGTHDRSDQSSPDGAVRPADSSWTRRDFVRTSAAAAFSAGALAGPVLAAPRRRRADVLHIGLVGCGGRGGGAAAQAVRADENAVIYAMADVFPDKLDTKLGQLTSSLPEGKVQVPEARRFVGFDAYEKLLREDIDVVILATPPHFRPAHIEASVDAGVHIFTEKPMAVDAPGVRSVMESVERARSKGLSLVAGFCWRYHSPNRATYGKILDGAIGDVVSMHATYHAGPLGKYPRKPEWSDMEWQLRNWWHFNWLSGDHLVEQACHSVDKIEWGMGGRTPIRATALGGRGVRGGPESGNVFDHFTVIYEYENDVKCYLTARQQPSCANDNSDYIMGTRGSCFLNGWGPRCIIKGENPWTYDGPNPDMYQVEHNELFASIRAGQPMNDGDRMMRSTMMAILGRMSAYTGQVITWDQAMGSKERLGPTDYEFGTVPYAPVPVPGTTQFV